MPDFAQVYVACALTNVQENWRRILERDCAAVVDTIHLVAGDDQWRVVAYDPITRTPPWAPKGKTFTSEEVWTIDTTKVIEEADALVIHGFQGGSIGVGIELALAFTRGIPILYLHHNTCDVTRMVSGMPAFLEIQPFFDTGADDRDRLREVVAAWLRRWRVVIEDGPSQRIALAQLFDWTQVTLKSKWQSLSEKARAEVAATARMTTAEVAEALRNSNRTAHLSVSKLMLLGTALGENVPALLAPRLRPPPLLQAELDALQSAKLEYEIGDSFAQTAENVARSYKEEAKRRSRSEGLVARLGQGYDFTSPNDWIRFIDDWKRGKIA